ncbi:MAG: hypothetical protein OEV49_15405 [candidate division Zixibacteria bacterium]|nr:hypothetical protein [candidate division Zixibacteria bacterium]MDH4033812.1 hypothetical protein [candidate division Zixibacteria bacterium]
MSTSVKQRQIEPILGACFGRRADTYLEALVGLKQAGIDFILINLPFHFQMQKTPSDLDLICDTEGYRRARHYLEAHGWFRLDRSPGSSQVVYVGYDSAKGLVRLHLHEHLRFFGVTWLTFEKAVNATYEVSGFRVAEAWLDYFVLHVEWFFRGKMDYPRRIDEVAARCDRPNLIAMGKRLFGRSYVMIERLERLNRSQAHPTLWRRLRLVFGQPGSIGGASAYMTHRILVRLDWCFFWRRRGLLVVIMGIDGSGKTTLAQQVAAQHDGGGLFCQYRYMGLKLSLVQRFRRLLRPGGDPRERYVGQRGIADSLAKRWTLLANMFNLLLSLFYILEYNAKCLFALAPIRNHNDLIIVDRTWLDKLMAAERWGNRLSFHLLPKPDLVIALHGDLTVFYKRAREFEVPVLSKMQAALNDALVYIEEHGIEVMRLDTVQHDLKESSRLVQEKIRGHISD